VSSAEEGGITRDLLVLAVDCLDLAVLDPGTGEEDVVAACRRAKDPGPGLHPTAGVCVLPPMVEVAARELDGGPVRVVAATGGFPEGTMPLERRQPEVKAALRRGAEEVDTVLNWRAVLAGNEGQAFDEIAAVAKWMSGKTLKVILETGALGSAENIGKAARIAMAAGAGFVKTCTGTREPATLEAARAMTEAVAEHYRETGKMVGVKVSGGVREASQALDHISQVMGVLGFAWLSPRTFRIGASGLLDDILANLDGC